VEYYSKKKSADEYDLGWFFITKLQLETEMRPSEESGTKCLGSWYSMLIQKGQASTPLKKVLSPKGDCLKNNLSVCTAHKLFFKN